MKPYRPPSTPAFEGLVEDLEAELDRKDRARSIGSEAQIGLQDLWFLTTPSTNSETPKAPTAAYTDELYLESGFAFPSLPSTDPETIYDEIGLRPDLTSEQISLLRRRFAARNHPDKFPEDLRAIATERMMIANALCDRLTGVPNKDTSNSDQKPRNR